MGLMRTALRRDLALRVASNLRHWLADSSRLSRNAERVCDLTLTEQQAAQLNLGTGAQRGPDQSSLEFNCKVIERCKQERSKASATIKWLIGRNLLVGNGLDVRKGPSPTSTTASATAPTPAKCIANKARHPAQCRMPASPQNAVYRQGRVCQRGAGEGARIGAWLR
jgi:hypothetical protein